MSHKGNKIHTLCQEGSLLVEQRSWALSAGSSTMAGMAIPQLRLLEFWERVTSCGKSEQEGGLPEHS